MYKKCIRCNQEKDISLFYIKKGKVAHLELTHSYCKKCVNEQSLKRQHLYKVKAVEYKGGKCEDCGLIDHPVVYDFHHIDGESKDFTIAHRRSKKITDEVLRELNKCMLLCSNCHRKRHHTDTRDNYNT